MRTLGTLLLLVTAVSAQPPAPLEKLTLELDPGWHTGVVTKVFLTEDGSKAILAVSLKGATSWVVNIPPGKHILRVMARSKDDIPGFSNEVEVLSPLPVVDRPRIYHLGVGIDKYRQTNLNLEAAKSDAMLISKTLIAQNQSGNGLIYSHADSKLLADDQATSKNVLDAISAIRDQAKPGDLFIFSFAGHGDRKDDEFFLLTHEADPRDGKTLTATSISGAALTDKLADFPCQVLVLLDACHSGQMGAGSDEAARRLSDPRMPVTVLCAAQGHELAQAKQGKGLFTDAIVRALKRDPNCFYDRKTGIMNMYHLQAFVCQDVMEASNSQQTPFVKMPLGYPPVAITRFDLAKKP